jgi:transcription initiation factor TFIID subunit 6
MKTLLLALISPGKSRGTREGAVRGLMGVGKEAVRKGLVDAGGARVVASECTSGTIEEVALLNAVMVRYKSPNLLFSTRLIIVNLSGRIASTTAPRI